MPQINPPAVNDDDATASSVPAIDEPYKRERDKLSYREERWFYGVRVGFLLLTALATAAIIVVYMIHLAAPPDWRWLSGNDLSSLQSLAVSIVVGLLMSLATTYFFKRK